MRVHLLKPKLGTAGRQVWLMLDENGIALAGLKATAELQEMMGNESGWVEVNKLPDDGWDVVRRLETA